MFKNVHIIFFISTFIINALCGVSYITSILKKTKTRSESKSKRMINDFEKDFSIINDRINFSMKNKNIDNDNKILNVSFTKKLSKPNKHNQIIDLLENKALLMNENSELIESLINNPFVINQNEKLKVKTNNIKKIIDQNMQFQKTIEKNSFKCIICKLKYNRTFFLIFKKKNESFKPIYSNNNNSKFNDNNLINSLNSQNSIDNDINKKIYNKYTANDDINYCQKCCMTNRKFNKVDSYYDNVSTFLNHFIQLLKDENFCNVVNFNMVSFKITLLKYFLDIYLQFPKDFKVLIDKAFLTEVNGISGTITLEKANSINFILLFNIFVHDLLIRFNEFYRQKYALIIIEKLLNYFPYIHSMYKEINSFPFNDILLKGDLLSVMNIFTDYIKEKLEKDYLTHEHIFFLQFELFVLDQFKIVYSNFLCSKMKKNIINSILNDLNDESVEIIVPYLRYSLLLNMFYYYNVVW